MAEYPVIYVVIRTNCSADSGAVPDCSGVDPVTISEVVYLCKCASYVVDIIGCVTALTSVEVAS